MLTLYLEKRFTEPRPKYSSQAQPAVAWKYPRWKVNRRGEDAGFATSMSWQEAKATEGEEGVTTPFIQANGL